tara:strand:+ start:229 stop:561 length:333 start_codon:yes stop_codon:yes gene_type:complete
MANLQKFRSHESDNTQSAAVWSQQTEKAVDATTDTVDVSAYHTVHLQTDEDIYFGFNSSTTDMIDVDESLYLKGGDTIYSLRVPHGIGNTVILQMREKTTTDATVRLVLS